MAGKIKKMIDTIIDQRSGGNPGIMETTKAKFMLRGINPGKFTVSSVDDPIIIEKILKMAIEFNVKL